MTVAEVVGCPAHPGFQFGAHAVAAAQRLGRCADRDAGQPLPAYPAACRPQAWAATTSVALLQAVLGIRPDVPNGTITVSPMRPAVVGAVRADGLQVAGETLTVEADAGGTAQVLTLSDLTVHTRADHAAPWVR